MGGAIFLLPGVKGLIANGKNPDGTYKTIDYASSKVVVRFDMSTNRNDLTVSVNPGGYLNYDSALKINSEGYLETHTGNIWYELPFANYATDSNGKIKLFAPKQVFRALDYNDKSIISSWAMPSNKYIDLTFGASGSTYIAPANGWFAASRMNTATSNNYLRIKNISSGLSLSHVSDSTNNAEKNVFLQVRKNDSVEISYGSNSSGEYLRFIYAEGEV